MGGLPMLGADRTCSDLIVLNPQKTYGWLGVDRTFLAADRTCF